MSMAQVDQYSGGAYTRRDSNQGPTDYEDAASPTRRDGKARICRQYVDSGSRGSGTIRGDLGLKRQRFAAAAFSPGAARLSCPRSQGSANGPCERNLPSVIDHVRLVDDLVYDVGLHKGEDSAFYLAKGYRVVAFEANDDLISSCRARFSREIAAGRMTLVEGAVSTSSKPTARFYKHPITVWGTTNTKWVARNLEAGESKPVDVPVVNFADMLRNTGMPSFMKIDIEGADTLCLEALLGFDQRPWSVSIESSQVWAELEAEFDLLERLGYYRFAVVQQATLPGRKIVTRTLDGGPLTFSFEADASGAFGSDIGPWMGRTEAMARYKRVFLAYRLLGHDLVRKTKLGRGLLGQAQRYLGIPLPGWYDTHAARSSTFGHL
jgi:FkbM family methyltransferase